jgi:hypothetical protein
MNHTPFELGDLMKEVGTDPRVPTSVSFDGVARKVRRRRRAQLSASAGTAVVVLAVGGAVLGAQMSNDGTSNKIAALAPLADGGTVTIDSDIGETFTPQPGNAAAAPMSAQGAYHAFSGRTTIPAGITYQFGTLTLPVNARNSHAPTEYTYRDRPVWAFSYAACESGFGSTRDGQTAAPEFCGTEWNFLDAASGKQLDQTVQH